MLGSAASTKPSPALRRLPTADPSCKWNGNPFKLIPARPWREKNLKPIIDVDGDRRDGPIPCVDKENKMEPCLAIGNGGLIHSR
eukprot:scaffold10446_cov153-Amphora_coffeaeformis.AAC.1